MKKVKLSKYVFFGLGILVTVALFMFGQHNHAAETGTGLALSGPAVVKMSAEDLAQFSEPEKKMISAVEKLCNQVMQKVNDGTIPKEEITNLLAGIKTELKDGEIKALQDELAAMDLKAKAQGTSLAEISAKLSSHEMGTKSISEVLKENEEELRKVYSNGSGTKTFMINVNAKGEFVMKPVDLTKAAGPTATITGVNGGSNASIVQTIDAASLLRMGANATIISQYRNSPWVFDLCNIVNAGFDQSMAIWYEETAKQGASATVAEGALKPLVQYAYELKSATYKKEAALVGFTDEFNLDFARLQSDILGKARIDLVNRINTQVLTNITAAATAYNTATAYKNGAAISGTNFNDYISIDAMAAQVDANTFGTTANAALMSTYKRHRIGTTMDSTGNWLNGPDSLANIRMVGNQAMGTDDVMVGDFTQYNIMLRGGLIVRVGYNGTDFAQNMFSVALEQFYFDYISSIRAKAIVKGGTFAAVKTAITT